MPPSPGSEPAQFIHGCCPPHEPTSRSQSVAAAGPVDWRTPARPAGSRCARRRAALSRLCSIIIACSPIASRGWRIVAAAGRRGRGCRRNGDRDVFRTAARRRGIALRPHAVSSWRRKIAVGGCGRPAAPAPGGRADGTRKSMRATSRRRQPRGLSARRQPCEPLAGDGLVEWPGDWAIRRWPQPDQQVAGSSPRRLRDCRSGRSGIVPGTARGQHDRQAADRRVVQIRDPPGQRDQPVARRDSTSADSPVPAPIVVCCHQHH